MKINKLLAIALGMGLAATAMADTASVSVSATVTGVCKFSTATGSVSFTLDPSSAGNATGTVTQPVFWCTKGTTYSITDNGGVNNSSGPRMKGPGATDFIPYSFTYTGSGTGAGKSSTVTMNIASSVVNSDFINATAGSYSDTMTLTIAP